MRKKLAGVKRGKHYIASPDTPKPEPGSHLSKIHSAHKTARSKQRRG